VDLEIGGDAELQRARVQRSATRGARVSIRVPTGSENSEVMLTVESSMPPTSAAVKRPFAT
jgi:hypothetical protein